MPIHGALNTFEKLISQVELAEVAALDMETSEPAVATVIRRSAYVLAVASVDTYFHEQVAKLLLARVATDASCVSDVSQYLGLKIADLVGPSAEAYVRYRMSYKTLVDPDKINVALQACGLSPSRLWLAFAVTLGSRPDHEQRQLKLIYDRRNQIAHAGDWDPVQLDFRPMTESHLADCIRCAKTVARGFHRELPQV